MNVTEANAVQALIKYLFDPHAAVAAEERARESLRMLADRSSDRLGAGRRADAVTWATMLDACPGCDACPADEDDDADQVAVETVQLAADGPL